MTLVTQLCALMREVSFKREVSSNLALVEGRSVVVIVADFYTFHFSCLSQDSKYNPDEFPASFMKGVGEGFWWSFISMTTVG